MLRFDVETISKATCGDFTDMGTELRFDVETISKATHPIAISNPPLLRFDVETISKATYWRAKNAVTCCGLM